MRQGASTAVPAATSAEDIPSDVVPHAIDPVSARRLRELSEALLKA
ncbi:hypothetical protein [Nonomuraea sp. PA05]|nr:hypothetical protein [Nonomuraea sp. PA05]